MLTPIHGTRIDAGLLAGGEGALAGYGTCGLKWWKRSTPAIP